LDIREELFDSNTILFISQGAQGVGTHNGGFRKALTHAYPEVRFTKWQAAYL